MNENEATSVCEFIGLSKQTLLGAYQHKMGQAYIFWRNGELPNSRDCQILIPVDGVRTARMLLSTLCLNMDKQQEIPLSELRDNIWIAREIIQPRDKINLPKLKVGRKDADCYLSIWSQRPFTFSPRLLKAHELCDSSDGSTFNESSENEFIFTGTEQEQQFDYGNTFNDGYEGAESELESSTVGDFEPNSDQSLAFDEQVRRIKAISKFLSEDELGSTSYVFPSSSGTDILTSSQIYFIHGVPSSFRLMRLATKLLKEFPFLNAVGLQKLQEEQIELGWQGKYSLQLVELIGTK